MLLKGNNVPKRDHTPEDKSPTAAPDVAHSTDEGAKRLVGFEIEYAGVPLKKAAEIVRTLYGGDIQQHSKAEWTVEDTRFGTFRLEIDAAPVKKFVSDNAERATALEDGREAIDDLYRKTLDAADDIVTAISEKVAPLEIIAPPVPIDDIDALEELRQALFYENAKGTRSSLHHAFGVHINPDAISLKASSLLAHMRAFTLLFPLLKEAHDVDFSRRIAPFIEPYSDDYAALILNEGYEPDIEALIRDYHKHNPSRNRALDMLPVFTHLEEGLVRSLYGEEEKINARPTYHYRLPNCDLSRGDWTLTQEWHRWCVLEDLACDQDKLFRLMKAWRDRPTDWLSQMAGGGLAWRRVLSDKLGNLGGADE